MDDIPRVTIGSPALLGALSPKYRLLAFSSGDDGAGTGTE
jgi:hypothetical protein